MHNQPPPPVQPAPAREVMERHEHRQRSAEHQRGSGDPDTEQHTVGQRLLLPPHLQHQGDGLAEPGPGLLDVDRVGLHVGPVPELRGRRHVGVRGELAT